MIEYIDIINAIKTCEGSFVTFLLDNNNCNKIFLNTLISEFKNEYEIEYDLYDLENINKKTIVIIDLNNIPVKKAVNIGIRSAFLSKIKTNKNAILIILKYVNFSIPYNYYTGNEMYLSNLIFTLKDNKLNIQKSRYTKIKHTDYLDISNIHKHIRKIKLKQIIKNN